MNPADYDPIVAALKEDLGNGDITTEFFVPEALHASGRIVAHESAVVAGTGTATEVFWKIDPATDIQIVHTDGDAVAPGDVVIEVRGLARSILKAERVQYWLGKGAQPTDTVRQLIKQAAKARASAESEVANA